jgi:phage tail protein X
MMVLHHYYAFTQSQLQKILRENHGINVYCVPTDEDPNIWFHNIAASFRVFTGTYEETLENALQEALKLI